MDGKMDIPLKNPLTSIRNEDGSLKDKDAWKKENSNSLTGLNVDAAFTTTSGHNLVTKENADEDDLEALRQEHKENL